mgnify:CR=1
MVNGDNLRPTPDIALISLLWRSDCPIIKPPAEAVKRRSGEGNYMGREQV